MRFPRSRIVLGDRLVDYLADEVADIVIDFEDWWRTKPLNRVSMTSASVAPWNGRRRVSVGASHDGHGIAVQRAGKLLVESRAPIQWYATASARPVRLHELRA